MSIRLNPYLSFDGNAREALEFYRTVFSGELMLSTFGEYGPSDGIGADKIMHGQLEAGDTLTFMAADNPPGTEYTRGNDIAMSLSGDDADTLRGYWKQLSEGGTVTVALEKQMWGDEFGMCTDRFGVSWMVNIAGDQA
ncbi:VOC family protein [Cellulomonas aerilata]|uniref:VOC family protein n=1 Tax=Cellulomonas aerilata TaxID=515326 RepID=A0A512D9Q3_9CELL|nr:VOC family protein [Cellulomonas aerilata]GEO33199.1 VOC family protein [Cellulomonas aerilata]